MPHLSKKAQSARRPVTKKRSAIRTASSRALPLPRHRLSTSGKKKYVYSFGGGVAEGHGGMKAILGGKGAGLQEMTRLGIPVPPGLTLSAEVCPLFYQAGLKCPNEVDRQMIEALHRVEKQTGLGLGDPTHPLLVSVRSGAAVSMPGMMDTILNVGLNDRTVQGLIQKTQNPRFGYDCYRRLIQMFGTIVLGLEKKDFDRIFEDLAHQTAKEESAWTEEDTLLLLERYKKLVQDRTGREFPQDPYEQVRLARDAVFKSWNNPRAITYRRLYNITHLLGTAVTVQTMVFGNKGQTSATGVGFTRNPSTGENKLYGEYLVNAQGEDVVAGIRTPHRLQEMAQEMPATYEELKRVARRLEKHYKDMQDFEFTVEEGKLYLLQTRTGKRTGLAALTVATSFLDAKTIRPSEAVLRLEPEHVQQLLLPMFKPEARRGVTPFAKGLNASPGAASGKIVFSAERALQETRQGQDVLLVRLETNPDDIQGMAVAKGILTHRGGMTSHAAVVSRQMGKPAVVGCSEITVSEEEGILSCHGQRLQEGDFISIDGTTGEVFAQKMDTDDSEVLQVVQGRLDPHQSPLFEKLVRLLRIAGKIKRLGVRANADTPQDARVALAFGAQGIGLCRTEHMFFKKERMPIVQAMILAQTPEEQQKALDQLFVFQKQDFKDIFIAMKGYPVTIRTLDPPLHEFLPKRESLLKEIEEWKTAGVSAEEIAYKSRLLARATELQEFNPMLGHRGCRLGITHPEITEMQARAIFEAACEVAQEGRKIQVEVMVPLTAFLGEFRHQKEILERIAQETIKKWGVRVPYKIGTMIEVPRAALIAESLAREAEFFSFGTNDLTQMGCGLSRDDVGDVLHHYIELRLLEQDPFVSLDQEGVGQLIQLALQRGRQVKKDLKVGICGEHGGDKSSIHFFDRVGLNYVSCSPYRVPIAIFEAAKARLLQNP